MRTVHDVASSIARSLSDLQEQFDTLRQMQQDFDHQVNAIYHEIETSNFNARDGYKYAKKLQDVLRQRRVVKAELISAKSIVDTLKPRDILGKVTKLADASRQKLDSAYAYIGQEVES